MNILFLLIPLGVLFAGAAYLPVSPGTPQARIASILRKAGPAGEEAADVAGESEDASKEPQQET